MKPAKDLSVREIFNAMQAKDLRCEVRRLFCHWHDCTVRAYAEQPPLPPMEMRRMELQAAEAILLAAREASRAQHATTEAQLNAAMAVLKEIAAEQKVYLGHGDYNTEPSLSAEEAQAKAIAFLSANTVSEVLP